MAILIFIVAIILFLGLIIVHEYGHFSVARRNGVIAEEFGIFFPPRLWKKKMKSGWTFSFNLLPLGGFVKLKGEHDADTEKGSYGAASYWAKVKIMSAGVFMNLITGIILLIIISWVGLPVLIPNQFNVQGSSHTNVAQVLVSAVETNSPAQKIGLKAEDQIEAIGPTRHLQTVKSLSDLQSLTKKYAGQTVELEYKQNGNQKIKIVTLRSTSFVAQSIKDNQPKGYLGVAITALQLRQYSWWAGPVEAIGLTLQIFKLTLVGLGQALVGLGKIIAGLVTANNVARVHGQAIASSQVSGPVGIIVILKDGSALGYQYMLLIIAIISLTLALMNFLPIPALDGGRLWLTIISRIFHFKLGQKLEERINAIGMVVLISLIILVTIVDINRFF